MKATTPSKACLCIAILLMGSFATANGLGIVPTAHKPGHGHLKNKPAPPNTPTWISNNHKQKTNKNIINQHELKQPKQTTPAQEIQR